MQSVHQLAERVLSGELLEKDQVLPLVDAPLSDLCESADAIRTHFNRNVFDMCSIINAKSGICSEDCRFCAQSARYRTSAQYHELLGIETLVASALDCAGKGSKRYSIVTSGKRLTDEEIRHICTAVELIRKKSPVALCISAGLLTDSQLEMLRTAGVTRIHNNLETSERFFPEVCSTHTFAQKVEIIRNAQRHGFEVCSGGIIGMGESFEDRIDLALAVRGLRAVSMPINILNPIPGTPFGDNEPLSLEEVLRSVAVFRFINPGCVLRLAGGRSLLADNGRSCFSAGVNAVITGDMLTTAGSPADEDLRMIRSLGYIL